MSNHPLVKKEEEKHEVDYTYLVNTDSFQSLIAQKRRFIIPTVISFLLCYFSLPILATYTTVLTGEAFFGITYVWIYALFQFIVIWGLGVLFMRKSASYDHQVEQILVQHEEELTQ